MGPGNEQDPLPNSRGSERKKSQEWLLREVRKIWSKAVSVKMEREESIWEKLMKQKC